MKQTSLPPLIILGVVLMAGCASSPEPEPVKNEALVETKQARVTRELTLSWDNIGRGGAAIRQPGYIHVLGDGNLHSSETKANLPKANTETPYTLSNAIAAVSDIDKNAQEKNNETVTSRHSSVNKGYSLYELSRWERFCNAGIGMDEDDWRFVTENGGAQNIPQILSDSCSLPNHDYQSYLDAWVNYCTEEKLTSTQRSIVRSSVRPKSVVNPCEAIKQ
ncbi:hypothetical protein [Pseudoalteromonas sp. TAB23]|uniref:hypothetical protein n=1 Tax=Pseudoalteromonas sp. TAB23 TaxID=1938595 RepID=UPI00042564EA|nr:hypothetical protein [Pseudoalteromonas sp. TAB23]